jgi:hypothetical protein
LVRIVSVKWFSTVDASVDYYKLLNIKKSAD